MQVEVKDTDPASIDAEIVGVPVAATGDAPAAVEGTLRERLTRLVADGELPDETGAAVVLHLDGATPAQRVAAAAIGTRETVDGDTIRTAAAAAARSAQRLGGTVAWVLDEALPLPVAEQARAAVEGVALGAYSPGRWKSDGDGVRPIERLVLLGPDSVAADAARSALVADWANRARDLVNAPPNELTPERLAERAQEVAASVEHLSVEALDRDEIGALGMGALSAVAQGSHNPPRLIVMRYDPPAAAASEVTLGLVGKAITFDTGGISIKPATHMESMKGDMAGGAAVLEGLGAVADAGVPVRAIAVVAATENMPGGAAYRPGDILRAMNGKTIEVINTDAEGRLVLADALWYARDQGATHLLDLATLTGAMELALGDLYAGLFANDDVWRDEILAAADASGEHLWPFPLHPRYRRYIRSSFADMKNASILRQGSPALAAAFLAEFVGEGPWAHIDMAGPGYLERSRGDYLTQQGGTGYGVRLIVELASRMAA